MQLPGDEVHICCVALDNFAPQAQKFYQQLTIDEKRRADRYSFAIDKKRYIIVRGILRQIIGDYLSVDPGKIEFNYRQHGKPTLTDIFSDTRLCFNVSYSGELALLAFTFDREVGVDIEYIRGIADMEQIVEHFFTDTEKKVFCNLSQHMRKEVFFQIWTRKEALLKAIGKGLYLSLDAFDVLPVSEKPVIFLDKDVKLNSEKKKKWYLEDLNTHPGFAAAYAVEGPASYRWIGWPRQVRVEKKQHVLQGV